MLHKRVLKRLLFVWIASFVVRCLTATVFLDSTPALVLERNAKDSPFERNENYALEQWYPPWVHGHWVGGTYDPESTLADWLAFYDAHGILVNTVAVAVQPTTRNSGGATGATLCSAVKSLKAEASRRNVRVAVNVHCATSSAPKNAMLPRGSNSVSDEPSRLSDCGAFCGATEDHWLLDLSNPHAISWLHRSHECLLTAGIDAFVNPPVDAIFAHHFPTGVQASTGFMDTSAFSERYYYGMLDHGRARRGIDFVTAFQSVGRYKNLKYHEFGPPDISYTSIVCCFRFSLAGLREAVLYTHLAVEHDHVNVGVAMPIIQARVNTENSKDESAANAAADAELFVRWMQLSAFLPIMWTSALTPSVASSRFGQLVPRISAEYEHLVRCHEELSPYFYSLGTSAFHAIHDDLSSFMKGSFADSSARNTYMQSISADATKHLGTQTQNSFLVGMNLLFSPVVTHGVVNQMKLTSERAEIAAEKALNSLEASIRVQFPRVSGQHGSFPSSFAGGDDSGDMWVSHHASHLRPLLFAAGSTASLSLKAHQVALFQRRGSIIAETAPVAYFPTHPSNAAHTQHFFIAAPRLLTRRNSAFNVSLATARHFSIHSKDWAALRRGFKDTNGTLEMGVSCAFQLAPTILWYQTVVPSSAEGSPRNVDGGAFMMEVGVLSSSGKALLITVDEVHPGAEFTVSAHSHETSVGMDTVVQANSSEEFVAGVELEEKQIYFLEKNRLVFYCPPTHPRQRFFSIGPVFPV